MPRSYACSHGCHFKTRNGEYKRSCHESYIRIPTAFSGGAFAGGGKLDASITLLDFAPSLLDACAIPVPDVMQGRSLLSLMRGEVEPHFHKKAVVCEYREAMAGHHDNTHASMVFDGRYKSVFYHGHALAELFDHAQDPEEYDNLWTQPGNEALKLQQLRAHMDALMATVDVGPPRFVNY